MKINTIFTDKNLITGEIETGIKEKAISNRPVMKGITTIKMINPKTGDTERELVSENLIKDAYYNMYKMMLRTPFTNIGSNGFNNSTYRNVYDFKYIASVPYTLYLLNDNETPIETPKQKSEQGSTVAWATWYDTFSNTSEYVRGTVVPALCCSFSDVANKRNVYRSVFEFPQHCGNGTFNKIQVRTKGDLYYPDTDGSYNDAGERRNRFTGMYSVDGYQTTHHASDVYNGHIYWLNHNDVMNKNIETKIYKADISKLKGVITGGGLTSSEITELCTIDLSEIDVVVSDRTKAGFSMYDENTAILVYRNGTSTVVVKTINLITGIIEDLGIGTYDFKDARDNYSTNSVSLSPDGTKLAIAGYGSTYYDSGYHSSYRIYDLSGNILLNKDRVGNGSSSYSEYCKISFVDDTHLVFNTYYYKNLVELSSDSTSVINIFALNSGVTFAANDGYVFWDKVIKRAFSFNKNTYYTLILNPSSTVLCENELIIPIEKTDTQIMRLQYDFIVPWNEKAVIYDKLDYDDIIPV
jgi:archaellin